MHLGINYEIRSSRRSQLKFNYFQSLAPEDGSVRVVVVCVKHLRVSFIEPEGGAVVEGTNHLQQEVDCIDWEIYMLQIRESNRSAGLSKRNENEWEL